MEKLRPYFDRPPEYKFRNDNFIITEYGESKLLFKGTETFRIILFIGIILKNKSNRLCLGYFDERNHYDYLSVSLGEKGAYKNLKDAMYFLSANFEIIKMADLKYGYLYAKGEVGFWNGSFDLTRLDMISASKKLLMRDSVPKKLSMIGKAYGSTCEAKNII